MDENNKLRLIDFGTASVFLKSGLNDRVYHKYKEFRQKSDNAEDIFEFVNSTRKSFVGTVYYVAPEMLEHSAVDKGCDLWALGVIIYRMLTGDYLFNDTNEYFIFQRIKECNYTLPEDMPENAKDLINQLLRKESKDRLGNGSREEGRDMEALKNHPFFSSIDFSTIQSISSPVKSLKKMSFGESNTDLSEGELFRKTSLTEFRGKQIVLSGLVKKYKYLFLFDTRQLILYSNGEMEYFDPKKAEVKGYIPLDNKCKVYSDNADMFYIQRPERRYSFKAIDIKADTWVKEIKSIASID